jgi:hypothetical protein
MSRIEGLSEFQIQTLYNHGFRRAEDVADADETLLASMPGIEKDQVAKIIEKAKAVLVQEAEEGALEKNRARMQAKTLLQIGKLFDKPEAIAFSTIQVDDATAQKLSVVGIEDIVDLHLVKFPEAAALSSQVNVDELKGLKKKATAALSAALGISLDA